MDTDEITKIRKIAANGNDYEVQEIVNFSQLPVFLLLTIANRKDLGKTTVELAKCEIGIISEQEAIW